MTATLPRSNCNLRTSSYDPTVVIRYNVWGKLWLQMPVPVDQKHLTRFLCTTAYYLKFLPNFSELCEPLRLLLKPDAVWVWSPLCQKHFDEIKRRIASPPILAHFDVSADTFVTADASGHAVGACLSQKSRDGKERPVAFASRTLSAAERKYREWSPSCTVGL